MAYSIQASIASFFFFFFLVVSVELQMVAGRNVPTEDKLLQPELNGIFDGSVLIPGIGRVMVPKKGTNPLHYNPITGAPGGFAGSVPGVGGSTGVVGGGSYVPGGDDTFMPNPGVEVPNPVRGRIPAPAQP